MRFSAKSLLFGIVILCLCSAAHAQRTLSYQGVVQDKNGALLEGQHGVTVKLYYGDDSTSFWEETQHPTFTKGLFGIVIGTVRKLPALAYTVPGVDHYSLGVSIDDGAELSPRTILSEAPAAFFADTAQFARNFDASALNFVPAVNGVKTALTVIGGGATSVTTRNDTIIINSPFAPADVIQGIINKEGSIDTKNGSGPVPEVSIAPLGVSTLNIAKGAVVTDRIAASAVANDRIAANAVTNDKIGSGGATSGFVLSSDGAGGASWVSPVAAALTLPYSTSVGSGANLFSLTNTGAGSAIVGTSTLVGVQGITTTSGGIGLLGVTADGGAGTITNSGVNGSSLSGNGVAGVVTTGNAIYGAANTIGIGVHGVTAAGATTARAGLFENLSSTATGNVLEAKSLGTGSAGFFQVNNSASAGVALDATTNGVGRAGRFQITNSSSSANALEVSTAGAGAALQATSSTTASNGNTAFVQNNGTLGMAIQGDHTGSGTGVAGVADGTGSTARGVFGWASNTAGSGVGVYGQSEGQGTYGVYGLSNNAAGNGIGVYGQTNSSGGSSAGLYGWASNTAVNGGYGVWGQTEAVNGQAVVGKANATTGTGNGVYGWARAASGVGIYGQTDGTSSTAYGVLGTTGSTATTATGYGVFGQTAGSGAGVRGLALSTTTAGPGVLGNGVWGVQGIITGNFAGGAGVLGSANAYNSSYGVFGTTGSSASSGTGVYALYGSSTPATGVTANALVATYNGGTSSTTTANNIAVFCTGTTREFRFANNGQAFTVTGGAWNSGGADLAEAFEVVGTKSEYEPGDVLVLSADETYHVAKSSTTYSKCIAGVYATAPGVLLGFDGVAGNDVASSSKVPMGVIGVLPTKVSTENGPIEVGDLLVTSSTPGYAMKGDESKLRFGNILGKAMEPLKSGKAVIKVLVGKY